MERRETADPSCRDCGGTGTVKLRASDGELVGCVCHCVAVEMIKPANGDEGRKGERR